MGYEYKVPTVMKFNQVYYRNRLITLDEFKKCLKPNSISQELINANQMALCHANVGPYYMDRCAIPLDKVIATVKSIDTMPEGYITVATGELYKDEVEAYLERGFKAGILAVSDTRFIAAMNPSNCIVEYFDLVIHGFEMISPNRIERLSNEYVKYVLPNCISGVR